MSVRNLDANLTLLVSGLLYAAIVLSVAGCSDKLESHYASLTEARRSAAVEHGWIPDTLAEGSFNIIEIHDVDTNEVWGSFQFHPRENPFSSRGIETTAS